MKVNNINCEVCIKQGTGKKASGISDIVQISAESLWNLQREKSLQGEGVRSYNKSR